MVNFGNVLRELRKKSNMTQSSLASKLGVTKSVISYYELQERTPSPEVLIKLAAVFNVTVDYLLGITDDSVTIVDISGLTNDDVKIVKDLVDHLKRKNNKG